jgi:hypothetical protein
MFATLRTISEIAAWFAGLGAVAIGAIVVGYYIPKLRIVSVAVVIASLSSGFFLARGINIEHKQNKAAEQNAIDNAVKAREDAVKEVDAGSTGRGTGVLRLRHNGNDKYDRDAGAVRGVASDHVQQPKRHADDRPANPDPQPNRPKPRVLVKAPSLWFCAQVKFAMASMSQARIDELAKTSTPEQREAARKCLEKK